MRQIEWETHDQDYIDQRRAEWAKTCGLSHRSVKRPTWEQLCPVAAMSSPFQEGRSDKVDEGFGEKMKELLSPAQIKKQTASLQEQNQGWIDIAPE